MGDLSTANGGASRILARPDNATLLFQESELRGMLTAFSMRGAEQARIARDKLLEIENTLKADKGGFAALVDPTIIRNRAVAERTLRAKVDADAALRAQYGAVWDNISATLVPVSYTHLR